MTTFQVSSSDMKRLAGGAREAAAHAAELLREKTAPSLHLAKDWASPRAQAAWQKGMTAAAPKVAEAAALLAPKVDGARDVIVEKALPAIVAAVDQAARSAAQAAQPAKPKHRGRNFVLFAILGSVIGGIAYWLWRQTRPLADPWAEDEWEALDQAPEEGLASATHGAADAVGEAAGTAVKKVTEVAKKAADAAKKAASSLTDHGEGEEAGDADQADEGQDADGKDQADAADQADEGDDTEEAKKSDKAEGQAE